MVKYVSIQNLETQTKCRPILETSSVCCMKYLTCYTVLRKERDNSDINSFFFKYKLSVGLNILRKDVIKVIKNACVDVICHESEFPKEERKSRLIHGAKEVLQ